MLKSIWRTKKSATYCVDSPTARDRGDCGQAPWPRFRYDARRPDPFAAGTPPSPEHRPVSFPAADVRGSHNGRKCHWGVSEKHISSQLPVGIWVSFFSCTSTFCLSLSVCLSSTASVSVALEPIYFFRLLRPRAMEVGGGGCRL